MGDDDESAVISRVTRSCAASAMGGGGLERGLGGVDKVGFGRVATGITLVLIPATGGAGGVSRIGPCAASTTGGGGLDRGFEGGALGMEIGAITLVRIAAATDGETCGEGGVSASAPGLFDGAAGEVDVSMGRGGLAASDSGRTDVAAVLGRGGIEPVRGGASGGTFTESAAPGAGAGGTESSALGSRAQAKGM